MDNYMERMMNLPLAMAYVPFREIQREGFAPYFVDHTVGIYPQSAGGVPFTATYFQSKGDAITDFVEDMAAEQKARTTCDNLLRLIDNPDARDPLKFLRAREIVHFQRFGEGLRIIQDNLNPKNFYAITPEFDLTKPKCGTRQY